MNSQYDIDAPYLFCVGRHMDEQEPFGDIPRKVAAAVRRSVVAARVMTEALKSAHEIAEQMKKVE